MDLRGSSVDWASRDKSSKKHVIEVGPPPHHQSPHGEREVLLTRGVDLLTRGGERPPEEVSLLL